jgi:small subunit ribosomal protein S35
MIKDAVRKGKEGQALVNDMEFDEDEDFTMPRETGKRGFWAEGEEDLGPDEDYFGDDLTSHGHGELEQHRELREYARLIAWELPLLSRTLISMLPAS